MTAMQLTSILNTIGISPITICIRDNSVGIVVGTRTEGEQIADLFNATGHFIAARCSESVAGGALVFATIA